MTALRIANLVLLALYPVAWAAPLMRAGLLPLFGLSEISVLSGIASLWEDDLALALLVALFALVAPMAKGLGLAALQFGLAGHRLVRPINWLGRLAMADIFLIAMYVVLAKGVGVGRVETAWGLYLFTACVLGSLAVGHLTERRLERAPLPGAVGTG